MEVYIVTGASRGIGDALATKLEAEGHRVLRVARTNPKGYENLLKLDIREPNALEPIMHWLEDHLSEATKVTLINNAGIIGPIEQVGNLPLEEILPALNINVAAPIALSNLFVKRLEALDLPKYIMNISSGAARNPYSGWAIYCTTKAALDHFSRVLNEEQKSARFPVFVTSIAPGVIDTEMQVIIRKASKEAFPNVERFIGLKENGGLLTPEETAELLLQYLESDLMRDGNPIADVRDL